MPGTLGSRVSLGRGTLSPPLPVSGWNAKASRDCCGPRRTASPARSSGGCPRGGGADLRRGSADLLKLLGLLGGSRASAGVTAAPPRKGLTVFLQQHVPQQVPYFIPRSTGRHGGPDRAAGGRGVSWTGLAPWSPPAPGAHPCAYRTLGLSQGFSGPEACLTFSPGNRALEADPRGHCESRLGVGSRDVAGSRAPGAGPPAGNEKRAGGAEPPAARARAGGGAWAGRVTRRADQ